MQAASNNDEEEFKDPSRTRVKLRILKLRPHTNDGNFSFVFRATAVHSVNGCEEKHEVAMKKMIIERTRRKFFRELELLRSQTLRHPHPNIIKLLFSQRRKYRGTGDLVYTLVFPFMPNTLAHLREELSGERNVLDIKLYIWQLFAGLEHLRKQHIIHRDVKPSNLLVDPLKGTLAIADFGSAIYLSPKRLRNQGNYAITRYYRPPELLLKTKRYTCSADVWSAGCIFAELFLGRPLFCGEDGAQQLQLIYQMLGTPTAQELRGMHVQEDKFVPANQKSVVWPLEELASNFKRMGYSSSENPAPLLLSILKFNPSERIHSRALLADDYFEELFEPGKTRKNGKLVSEAIQRQFTFGTDL